MKHRTTTVLRRHLAVVMPLVVLLTVSIGGVASAAPTHPAAAPAATPPKPVVLHPKSKAEMDHLTLTYPDSFTVGNLTFGPLVQNPGPCLQPSQLGNVDRTALTLTDQQMMAYGLPPKPTSGNPAALASWKQAVKAVKTHICTHRTVNFNATGQQYTNQWAGNEDANYPNTFSQASANWGVEKIASTAYISQSATWVGIGWDSNNLIQVGTFSNVQLGQTPYYASFWENTAQLPSQANTAFPVNEGNQMFGDLSDGDCMYLEDVTTGASTSPCQGPNTSGTDAAYLVERPSHLGVLLPLADFGYANFYNTANSAPGSADSQPHNDVHMTNGGGPGDTPCATAASWSNDAFRINWNDWCA